MRRDAKALSKALSARCMKKTNFKLNCNLSFALLMLMAHPAMGQTNVSDISTLELRDCDFPKVYGVFISQSRSFQAAADKKSNSNVDQQASARVLAGSRRIRDLNLISRMIILERLANMNNAPPPESNPKDVLLYRYLTELRNQIPEAIITIPKYQYCSVDYAIARMEILGFEEASNTKVEADHSVKVLEEYKTRYGDPLNMDTLSRSQQNEISRADGIVKIHAGSIDFGMKMEAIRVFEHASEIMNDVYLHLQQSGDADGLQFSAAIQNRLHQNKLDAPLKAAILLLLKMDQDFPVQ